MSLSKKEVKKVLDNLKYKKPRMKIKPPKVIDSKKTYKRKENKKYILSEVD